jgi:hypothetical protein
LHQDGHLTSVVGAIHKMNGVTKMDVLLLDNEIEQLPISGGNDHFLRT